MKKLFSSLLFLLVTSALILPSFVFAALPVEPTATLTASPNPVNLDSESIISGITTLTWSSTNADTCVVTEGERSGFDTNNKTSGSDNSSTLSVSTTFAISCTGFGGTATASVYVSVSDETDPPETPPVSGSCSANRTSATTDQSVTWAALPSGGTGSYTYTWSGTSGLSGNSISVSKTYTTTGTKTASVTITSNGESTIKSCSNSVTVSSSGDDDDDDDDDDDTGGGGGGGGGGSSDDPLIIMLMERLVVLLKQYIQLLIVTRM